MKKCVSPDSVPARFRLPDERQSLTHRFRLEDFKGCLTIGFYPDGRVGEIFIEAEKQGSTIRGMLGAFAKAVSIGLQYGIPIEHFSQSFKHLRFTPEGYTDNKDVHRASSITDYIFKYLDHRLTDGYLEELRIKKEPGLSLVKSDSPSYEETSTKTSSEVAISCKATNR